ncbi:hypothetical protein COLO4_29144 [Corchorus olitorius]|uniref:Uncharacterized protein n=1 Tax=Corchorus olitorius TaxID=93759 RepID=A0A1R3HG77_9ROSI|nr:hypothetical protein COLO4_29144 [Corchorus olitorius]
MKFQSPMAFKFHPNAPRCPLITALCSFPHESQQIPLDLSLQTPTSTLRSERFRDLTTLTSRGYGTQDSDRRWEAEEKGKKKALV